ncbi:MAG: DUF29 domain-containing protein [Spirulina sp.]
MVRQTIYSQDFLEWTEHQIVCLQQGQWENIDIDNLVEELGDLGRSEQKELGSYLKMLIMHLLKWQYQPECRTTSWKMTISNIRDAIQDCLEDSSSLQRFLNNSEWVEKYYRRARRDAAKETQMTLDRFPSECPYNLKDLLNSDFFPASDNP